ncbi:MAG: metal ABC transporter permease [Gemmataceae bacterium]|nr:metal ABC transporter permease [Gemmataceae bacterium]
MIIGMMFGLEYNEALVLYGASLLGAAAGVIGCFAVLRGRALTGDALAHAALPGLCVAFLWYGALSMPALLAGAAVSGVLGIGVITALRRWTRIKEDAAIAIVLSVFTGAGVVLLSVIQNQRASGQAGLQGFIFGSTASMNFQDVMLITGLALVALMVVTAAFKEFKLVSFDAAFARAQGWPAFAIDFTLMLLIVVAIVIGLPAAGVLLMAALLVVPGAAARFWTDRLHVMLILAGLFGAAAGLTGAGVTITIAIPTGPVIILAAATIFVISMLFAPRRGLIARQREDRQLRQRLTLPNVVTGES